MKKVNKIFKNAYSANKNNLNEMVARIDYNPHKDNELANILVPYIYCLRNAKVEEFDECIQSRDRVFNSIFDGAVSMKIDDSFVDRVSILLAMDKITCDDIKCMTTELGTANIETVLKRIETMATNGVLTRNLVVSITNLVARNKLGLLNFVPHIQMAIYDGHLFSPSGTVFYVEKILSKTRMVLIKKEPISLKKYNYTLYELDNNCNILSSERVENVKIDKDIFKTISLKRLFRVSELYDKLINWFSFKPSKGAIKNDKNEYMEQEKSTT